jgi:rRNA maturation protein Nop10
MKQQEIMFKCQRCEEEVVYGLPNCSTCGGVLHWNNIRISYEDKYIDIYEVRV